MTVVGWRRWRLFLNFGLLVSLPLTGYLWAQLGVSPGAIAMSVASAVMAISAGVIESIEDALLANLLTTMDKEGRSFASQVADRDENVREMDRIVEVFSRKNDELRDIIVSAQGEMPHPRDDPEEGGSQSEPSTKD